MALGRCTQVTGGACFLALWSAALLLLAPYVEDYRASRELEALRAENLALEQRLATSRKGGGGFPTSALGSPMQLLGASGGPGLSEIAPPERRLGPTFILGTSGNVGCFLVSMSGGDTTIDVSGSNCNSAPCPFCFMTYGATTQSRTLTVSNCNLAKWNANTAINEQMVEWTFINTHNNYYVIVSDGTNTRGLAPGSGTRAWCFEWDDAAALQSAGQLTASGRLHYQVR